LKNPNYHLLVAGNRHQHNQLSLNFLWIIDDLKIDAI
jgi:hypothetical protein